MKALDRRRRPTLSHDRAGVKCRLAPIHKTRRALMRSHLVIPMVVFLAATHAGGQGSAYQREVFGAVGVSRMGSDEGSLGSGPHVPGGVGVRLAARAWIELDVMRTQHERDIAGGPL